MSANPDEESADDPENGNEGTDTNSGERRAAASAARIFDSVEVEIEARLGCVSMTVKELLGLEPGGVVALDRSIGDPVDLRLNGKAVARGEIVTVEEKFAIRITELRDIE